MDIPVLPCSCPCRISLKCDESLGEFNFGEYLSVVSLETQIEQLLMAATTCNLLDILNLEVEIFIFWCCMQSSFEIHVIGMFS
jgi:hypothetical protein